MHLMRSLCNNTLDTILFDALLLREACLWHSRVHYGVDQKVLKYTLKVGIVSTQRSRGTYL